MTDKSHALLQLNLSTAGEAYQSVDSDDFFIQLDLTSNDTNFNNTHPRLQVSVGTQLLQAAAGGCTKHLPQTVL